MIHQQSTIPINPAIMVLVFMTWTLLTVGAVLLWRKKTMTRNKAALSLTISVIGGGLVLGALPNPIQPISQLLLALRGIGLNVTLVPMILALGVLLASTLIVGRAYCGQGCPLGAMQELLSRIKFKASITEQRRVKGTIRIPERNARYIRVIVLVAMAVITVAWGIAIIQLTSPFLGFRVFMTPAIATIAIPLVALAIIAVTSVFVYRPWCRLACPFGTLAGFTSRLSRFKIRRTSACTDCGVCEKICPVGEASRDASKADCFLCHRCVEACPRDAIVFNNGAKQSSDDTKRR